MEEIFALFTISMLPPIVSTLFSITMSIFFDTSRNKLSVNNVFYKLVPFWNT